MMRWLFIGRRVTDDDPDVAEAMFDPDGHIVVWGCDLTEAPIFARFLLDGRTVITERDV